MWRENDRLGIWKMSWKKVRKLKKNGRLAMKKCGEAKKCGKKMW